ncbi:Obg family GTPase CgtA [Enterobacteriaceae endosymbiont of Neohaemonia nigricornis]|uniref:Obg family GTPase CgtA n=1 Tax=Enterobacteriaceae endosymbiont of Neohaemonia nigricornis TaxID=2675792 RepID=UPI0014492FE8|nr:Obg family GTPase CgtA [Enterobacteriaceae endosymbiont of Neohaemonia nigricornis]QJC30614.1 Obg family GTPase CgtA [Enterobacteriaceae endosymbiont of Neohaemonia nigricornis]
MKFIDEAEIFIIAGKGGNGCTSFRREKYIAKGGPDGGNGGNGGNVYFITNNNINNLSNYYHKKYYIAENGCNGQKYQRTGKKGKDLILNIPIGTKIIDIDKNLVIAYLNKNNQKILIAKGGICGLGNINFKSSINRTPYKNTKGQLGEHKKIRLKLILFVEVGLIGMPNTGKSTLINSVSNVNTKVSDYPFTTKQPVIGIVKNNTYGTFTILDTPGIIRNSFLGSGLGLNFIKQFKYCNLILHIIDITQINKFNLINNINIINNELKNFDNILHKEIWFVFNKIDLVKKNINHIQDYIKYTLIKFSYINKCYFISAKFKTDLQKLYLDIFKYLNKYLKT